MILEYYQADLLEKKIFVRAKFKPPLKATQTMISEACLLYNLKGPSYLYGADHTEFLSSEESALMKCGNYISDWKPSTDDDIYEVITIHFYPDVLKLVFENNIPDYLQKPLDSRALVFKKIEANAILKSYIDSLLIYFDNPELFNTDTIKLKIKELVALLYRMDIHGVRELLSNLFNVYELDFKKVVEEHLFHDLSLKEFATLLNLSTSTFKRRFKKIYRSSPGQYIKNKKLEKAAALLSTSSQRIGDICYESGFKDISNFTKYFKTRYGKTPTEYQRSFKI